MAARLRTLLPLLLLGGTAPVIVHAQQAPQAAPAAQQDAAKSPLEVIKDEGLNRSQVLQTLSYLTDVIGPRLTASPNCKRASEWTRDKLASWGLQKAALEPWGPFGRGWSLKRFSAQVTEPQAIPLIAYPKAWSPGTDGPVTGPVIYLDAKDEAGLEKYKGQLKGAMVMISNPRELKAHFELRATRKSDTQLLDLANAGGAGGRRGGRGNFAFGPEQRTAAQVANRKLQMAIEEGAAVIVDISRAGDDATRPTDGGTVFVQSISLPTPAGQVPGAPGAPGARRPSAWDANAPKTPPQITLCAEHYNRLVRMIGFGEKPTMTVDVAVQFHEGEQPANTVAEIPGSDLAGEVVMVGGHLDSWHTGTGATDNGAGVAAAMEAVRILQASGLKPRRTIRIGLWTGEEEGLLGSKAYVTEHFGVAELPMRRFGGAAGAGGGGAQGQPAPMPKITTKPEFEKISAYFNLDNGTGKIRGIYLQGNEQLRTLFRDWLTPFRDMGAATISPISVGGTDHGSFDTLGIPAFQFIQDEIEYSTRTHHSNMDVFDRIQADDMKQASVIIASFLYNTAMRDVKLPRKSMTPATAP